VVDWREIGRPSPAARWPPPETSRHPPKAPERKHGTSDASRSEVATLPPGIAFELGRSASPSSPRRRRCHCAPTPSVSAAERPGAANATPPAPRLAWTTGLWGDAGGSGIGAGGATGGGGRARTRGSIAIAMASCVVEESSAQSLWSDTNSRVRWELPSRVSTTRCPLRVVPSLDTEDWIASRAGSTKGSIPSRAVTARRKSASSGQCSAPGPRWYTSRTGAGSP
jgi:hypothetical protein